MCRGVYIEDMETATATQTLRRDAMSITATELHQCAECGHLHFISPDRGYESCPICPCEGQWVTR